MKPILFFVIAATLAYGALQHSNIFGPGTSSFTDTGNHALYQAFAQRQSDLQVAGEGVVSRVLADDLRGSKHQRFILQVGENRTLLVAHNIDLAPRIENLAKGDRVAFYGEYEWNEKGGVVHWTHHDPNGRHTDGWLKHQGKTYQ